MICLLEIGNESNSFLRVKIEPTTVAFTEASVPRLSLLKYAVKYYYLKQKINLNLTYPFQ